jgi:Reverse transcriptase (RNA-dependent DNA polymerase)
MLVKGKMGGSMILKKGPLHSMPGNLIIGADAPDMEGVPMKFPAQVSQIPPEGSLNLNQNEEIIHEGEDPSIWHIQTPFPASEGVTIRRIERIRMKMLKCFELLQQLAKGIALSFKAHEANAPAPRMYQKDLILREQKQDPIAVKTASNLDTPCLHEALLAPSAAQFREAAKKEVNESKGPWWVIGKSDVPCNPKILLVVWSRRIKTCKVYKSEARLNLWVHKQVIGVRYQETYSLVVRWEYKQLMPMLLALHGWSMGQSDVVIAYHQADMSTGHVYIVISKGFDSHCLPILKSIYSVQEAGITGDQYLVKG